jgi:hypothetical protein
VGQFVTLGAHPWVLSRHPRSHRRGINTARAEALDTKIKLVVRRARGSTAPALQVMIMLLWLIELAVFHKSNPNVVRTSAKDSVFLVSGARYIIVRDHDSRSLRLLVNICEWRRSDQRVGDQRFDRFVPVAAALSKIGFVIRQPGDMSYDLWQALVLLSG